MEDAGQIDHGLRAGDGAHYRSPVADIGGDRGYLAKRARRLQEQRFVGASHGRAHQPAAPRQVTHHIAADKARPAEHRRQALHAHPALRPLIWLGMWQAIAVVNAALAQQMPIDFEPVLDRMRRAARPAIRPGSLGPGGGIGRRAGFRYLWGNPWKFESSP